MIKLRDTGLCTGCGVCVNVCPKSCVVMKEDKEGFPSPFVDADSCIECGKCVSACERVANVNLNRCTDIAIAAWAKDPAIRCSSSSGGVFSVLAQWVLSSGGVINGVAFDEDFSLRHKLITTMEELSGVRGSRYVQSDVGTLYQELRRILDDGRKVLFTSTPCQVAGLKGFLGREYDNLLTCDFICHGVPSPRFFKTYVGERVKTVGQKKAIDYTFRDATGWGWAPTLHLSDETQVQYEPYSDPYMAPFLAGYNYRESCYKCKFARPERCADITIGDFWSVKDYSLFTRKYEAGCSLVLLNTPKGEWLFGKVADACEYEKYPLYAAYANKQLWNPCDRPMLRNVFYTDVNRMKLDALATKYCYKAVRRHPLHHIADALRWLRQKSSALKYVLKVKCGVIKI